MDSKSPKAGDSADASLPAELRSLVSRSVALLGEVIRHEGGTRIFNQVESIRSRMASLRGASPEQAYTTLRAALKELDRLSRADRRNVAHSFTLMLELMNACENAYRSHRIRGYAKEPLRHPPDAMIYVVTAHPTEARAPANIELFHRIQLTATRLLEEDSPFLWDQLRNELELAWHLQVAKGRRPQVRDEADHIYSIILRDENIQAQLSVARELGPVYIRSWVGGDKDGHPGVSEVTLRQSLQLSRSRLLRFFRTRLEAVRRDLELLGSRRPSRLQARAREVEARLRELVTIRPGDGARVSRLHSRFRELSQAYESELGVLHPALADLRLLIRMYPALVVPMELREGAELIHAAAAAPRSSRGSKPAITRMLETLALLARGTEPRFYARGLIISMASSRSDIEAAMKLVRRTLGGLKLPVIPLFEQQEALEHSDKVVKEVLSSRETLQAIRSEWEGHFEVMLGYSDSAKEAGALMSRLSIMEAVQRLDRVFRDYPVKPVFFHGSGGSTDRGGGTIEEQTEWWPPSARRLYKATIQGEMVERAFASPEITRRRFEQIARQASASYATQGDGTTGASRARAAVSRQRVEELAHRISQEYRGRISRPEFLDVVQRGTPYRYLTALKIGSRPAKRSPRGEALSVSGLRAIPWVLCWTQTRVLFPTWWGVGTAWRELQALARPERERRIRELRQALEDVPVFRAYFKVLASTLARVELPVWRVFLESSGVDPKLARATLAEFEQEYRAAVEFVRALSGSRDLLWFRPWFGTSIRLRSPMIHPLNLLQCLAIRDKDVGLLRETVTGIASGMMTTG